MAALAPDVETVTQLLARAEAERPVTAASLQRIAGLNQYLSACKREARDRGRNRARPTASF